jgi:GH35 family endo-1,4-beta-xylanase
MITKTYESLWSDPTVARRIDDGIERNRKSDLTLTVHDRAGKPVVGQRVTIEQTSSEFLFGANLFMVGCYDDPAIAGAYEKAYVELFNAGTVSLYWRDLEPTPGKLRFTKDSPFIRRRPPVDLAVEFGQRHGLNLSGHPLVWDFIKWSVPDWLTDEASIDGAAWERRIAQIAERYGHVISRWDVVNEVMVTEERLKAGLSRPMPPNYARKAFEWCEKHMPASAHLMINDVTQAMEGSQDRYGNLIQQLLDQKSKIDGIGLQLHMFQDEEIRAVARGERFHPNDQLAMLDRYARFNRPIHISEITLTSPRNDPDGLAVQAEVARNFYRMWFSHPAVHAITWWNVPDGAAAPGEDSVNSGLLDRNMNPKPSYTALQQLIRNDWRTRLAADTDANGQVRFRGFHGVYSANVAGASAKFPLTHAGGETTVRLEQ